MHSTSTVKPAVQKSINRKKGATTTEQDCANHLPGLRWPNGFICPTCQHLATPYKATRGRLLCIPASIKPRKR
ncbi:MAG: transposase, partial [Betaproteobacteria bacterium]|nr:transposase [Betaproteobacteria bacterium]